MYESKTQDTHTRAYSVTGSPDFQASIFGNDSIYNNKIVESGRKIKKKKSASLITNLKEKCNITFFFPLALLHKEREVYVN